MKTPPPQPEASPERKPYRRPTLVCHGHMASVTQKSGPGIDASPTWANKK